MTFAEKQEQYAKLLVKLGVNIQPEQELVVRCAAEAAPFARLVAKEAYEAGAKGGYRALSGRNSDKAAL